jgi:hypothetical protein
MALQVGREPRTDLTAFCGRCRSAARRDKYTMRSFQSWLEHRLATIPDATSLGLVIARAGRRGVSRDDLARIGGVHPDTLKYLLGALVVAGQVALVKVGGELRYRVVG